MGRALVGGGPRQRRGAGLGSPDRGIHGGAAAALRDRDAAGEIHGTGGHRPCQRAGPGRTARLRRRAVRAAPGGDAGCPRCPAGRRVRRSCRRGRPVAGNRPDVDNAVQPGRYGDRRRLLERYRRPHAVPGRHPGAPRRSHRDRSGVRDRSRGPHRRLHRSPRRSRRRHEGLGRSFGHRRADHHRGAVVGCHLDGVHRPGTAAGTGRGPAGCLHRTHRHRGRQRADPGGAARLRRGAVRAAPGGDAGRPCGALGNGVRRGRRGSREAPAGRLHGHHPV